ncbi:putative NAD-dependent aldehyde dehydrogenase [Monocercomonoides exilis]|uniref:putative NAD-dependent aldehyde dehydrogenase n=1 Tax=Monocercomonoides exilis TaxID=2049356 RepID=UPI0035595176|nr:putative NAD-dependent aldehyde dehydrogenase [Monocercomonoides exilis]|eukprot:MONOS_4261.1-p1 / transcript=MONOS_4261.1 / gene=MONOS_4261 / organism=Monocercomonoides_exilis_PA203 / gene_product=NAD-dependent aldehyde dehydrogenase / transcript_product=NAD-dependent aldehyde dehydrogenase / location=Mono_scaffold00111:33582-36338(+) / protein_length=918 / sequence_SO=supercontig / SO=protein_coding / is_pseudo=false
MIQDKHHLSCTEDEEWSCIPNICSENEKRSEIKNEKLSPSFYSGKKGNHDSLKALKKSISYNDVIEAHKKLHQLFRSGASFPSSWRLAQLKLLQTLLTENFKDFETALFLDFHKSSSVSYLHDLGFAQNSVAEAIKHLSSWCSSTLVSTPVALLKGFSSSQITPYPLGVVLLFPHWSSSLLYVFDLLAGALAAGCCICLVLPNQGTDAGLHVSGLLQELIPKYFVDGCIQTVFLNDDAATIASSSNLSVIEINAHKKITDAAISAERALLCILSLTWDGIFCIGPSSLCELIKKMSALPLIMSASSTSPFTCLPSKTLKGIIPFSHRSKDPVLDPLTSTSTIPRTTLFVLESKNPVIISLKLTTKRKKMLLTTAKAGQDPFLSMAVKKIVTGKFMNCGQTIVAPDYVIISEEIQDLFVEEIKAAISECFGSCEEEKLYEKRVFSGKDTASAETNKEDEEFENDDTNKEEKCKRTILGTGEDYGRMGCLAEWKRAVNLLKEIAPKKLTPKDRKDETQMKETESEDSSKCESDQWSHSKPSKGSNNVKHQIVCGGSYIQEDLFIEPTVVLLSLDDTQETNSSEVKEKPYCSESSSNCETENSFSRFLSSPLLSKPLFCPILPVIVLKPPFQSNLFLALETLSTPLNTEHCASHSPSSSASAFTPSSAVSDEESVVSSPETSSSSSSSNSSLSSSSSPSSSSSEAEAEAEAEESARASSSSSSDSPVPIVSEEQKDSCKAEGSSTSLLDRTAFPFSESSSPFFRISASSPLLHSVPVSMSVFSDDGLFVRQLEAFLNTGEISQDATKQPANEKETRRCLPLCPAYFIVNECCIHPLVPALPMESSILHSSLSTSSSSSSNAAHSALNTSFVFTGEGSFGGKSTFDAFSSFRSECFVSRMFDFQCLFPPYDEKKMKWIKRFI